MNANDQLEFQRKILEYWTLVEFFSPYFLDNVLNSTRHYQRVYADDPADLPWSNEKPLNKDDPESAFAKGYHLYLGLFSTEETADRARHVFHEKPSEWQSVDWRQCGSVENLSCFARLTLTKFGTPILGSLSLSTLPWAHGCLLNHDAALLTMESYWKSVQRFLIDLREEFMNALPMRLVREPTEKARVLNHETLCQLIRILCNWAGYFPNDYPIALVAPFSGEEKKTVKDPGIESEKDIPILNSFYIQELERAKDSLDSQRGTPLDRYLSGKCEARIPLDSERGKTTILNALKPSRLPKGRWPANASQQQTLMQQFAVNQALHSLQDNGLFSVNGPPGTGKTTLLREIIAENMVARAIALAQFKSAKATFTGKLAMGFGDGDPVHASDLHPSLTGYEMVMVSSNNTAVQNLSLELPLRKELDPSFSRASYLEPVARRLLGVKKNEAWGLISAAIGNRENCRRLVDNIFISHEEGKEGLRIWDWTEQYQGPSFIEARNQFLTLHEKLETLQKELDTLSSLHNELSGGELEEWQNKILQEIVDAEKIAKETEEKLTILQKEEEEVKELLRLSERRVELWNKERPGIVYKLIKRKTWNEWSEQSSVYTQQQIVSLEELHAHKERIRALRKQLQESHTEIEEKELELLEWSFWAESCKEMYQNLREAHPDFQLPEKTEELDDPKVQKQTYFQNNGLNNIRTELFIAAMTLHEAWLAETLRPKGGFRGNLMAVSNLLQGKSPTTAGDTLLAWQSLFLLIPVISSTFASVGRLFRYLEPQSLGWVFIDEAGQALPQAAVGAIWRAKRVLSIGDPFQIEPISTIPAEIIDGMAKQRLQDHCLSWAPSLISVQNLMDAATQYVSKRQVSDIPCWLGSPLRVHRRCIEPMFSIANEIAYDNSMVLATTVENCCPLPESCWYDIKGVASERQYVPAQGIELVRLLSEALKVIDMPCLYVISPFREVVRQIRQLILHNENLKKLFKDKFKGICLRSWTEKSVGTVHSFQGKQAIAVFFVLGADQTIVGSIEWATRKPNLLNVAVTRACQRFYMIGDCNLWSRWPYFDTAAKKLKRVTSEREANCNNSNLITCQAE